MVRHDFKVKTEWLGGREEVGKLRGDIINENISIPLFTRWPRRRHKSR